MVVGASFFLQDTRLTLLAHRNGSRKFAHYCRKGSTRTQCLVWDQQKIKLRSAKRDRSPWWWLEI